MLNNETKIDNDLRSKGFTIDEFIHRIESCKSNKELVAIIEQIVEEPWFYVYGELLELKQIKNLEKTEYEKHLNLLKLFAYGKCQTFLQSQDCFPPLSSRMIEHLRQLTIVSLGEKDEVISYECLLNELSLTSVRELEAIIIETIGLNLIKGTIDQEKCCLEVHETVARDVIREDIPIYVETIREWFHKCDHILNTIELEIGCAYKLAEDANNSQNILQEKIETAKYKETSSSSLGNYGFDTRRRDDKNKRSSSQKYLRNFRTPKSNKKD